MWTMIKPWRKTMAVDALARTSIALLRQRCRGVTAERTCLVQALPCSGSIACEDDNRRMMIMISIFNTSRIHHLLLGHPIRLPRPMVYTPGLSSPPPKKPNGLRPGGVLPEAQWSTPRAFPPLKRLALARGI